MKGYRSDYDILIIVNTKKLTDPNIGMPPRIG
ncbi:hypothetical protein GGE12_005222 [Rhizobium mongolense]|uniref:Uncharacterized protein n=1 Tax=Rhizobium mongolense TaxID=57676 RepID=A0A7W6WGY0_9HYPH|nr:hypothetical protein [Rhizobium mongolense]